MSEYDNNDWLIYGSDEGILAHLVWVLWDSSSCFISQHGMPTNAQVQVWVELLKARDDSSSPAIQQAISTCEDYMKPVAPYTPPPAPKWIAVTKGLVIRVKKIS